MQRGAPGMRFGRAALLAGLASLAGCGDDHVPDAGAYVRLRTTQAIVNTDCLAPGQPVARGSWPADDRFRFRSMPPGCAVANAVQRMTMAPADLLRGRPLPPGAALPVGRAIERYYSRAETVSGTAVPGLGAGTLTPVTVPPAARGAADDAAPGGNGADLLQGPLVQPTTAPAATAPPP